MNKTLYRLLVKAVPKPKLRFGDWTGFSVSEELAGRLIRVLERERVQGGVLALRPPRASCAWLPREESSWTAISRNTWTIPSGIRKRRTGR